MTFCQKWPKIGNKVLFIIANTTSFCFNNKTQQLRSQSTTNNARQRKYMYKTIQMIEEGNDKWPKIVLPEKHD